MLNTAERAAELLRAGGLPLRWQGRKRFVVLDTDFDFGHAFIATWRAWRADPQRCRWLVVVALCTRLPSLAALRSAHDPGDELAGHLAQAWPPLTPDLHTLDFEQGHVRLLLTAGRLRTRLQGLRLQADLLWTRSADLAADPRLIEVLGRKAAISEAALAADGGSAARLVASMSGEAGGGFRRTLTGGGFLPRDAGDAQHVRVADHAPRFVQRRLPDASSNGRSAVVIGAGIGGAAVASALARSGFEVTVLDRRDEPASQASGNPAGLFHGVVHRGNGPHARLYRAAALHAQRVHAHAIGHGGVPGCAQGLLRSVTPPQDLCSMQALLTQSGLPQDYVQALDAAAASALAGVTTTHPAWYYPGGGWIDPRAWVRHALAQPGVRFVGGAQVSAIVAGSPARGAAQGAVSPETRTSPHGLTHTPWHHAPGEGWQVQGPDGVVLARADVLVLAPGTGTIDLAPMAWPLSCSRGQITFWSGADAAPTPLQRALAGTGYALPLPDGGLVCGATHTPADEAIDRSRSPERSPADDQTNLRRLYQLCGLQAPGGVPLQSRAGWRVQTADRLPIAGAMPIDDGTGRRDQVRLLPRAKGLFVLTALGSRGLSLAPLLAELIAAQASGAPWPLPQELADAVDPGRWMVRAARSSDAAAAADVASAGH